MSGVKIILNPYSGRGGGARMRPLLQQALARAGVEFDIAETQGVGHGIELARQARLQGYTTVVAAGGDGTFSEVMNGLAQAATPSDTVGRLALIPIGSGNDLADMLNYPRDLDAIAQVIAAGRTRCIDLGHATIRSGTVVQERYFDNNMGVGFEARVTLESYKIKRMSGTPLYVVAALRALRHYTASRVELTLETEQGETQRKAQAVLLVTIGNSRRTGGGFYLTPDALMDDGLLDVGIADAVSRWRVLTLLPKALQGTHVSDPAFTLVRCRKIHISCRDTLPVQLDGEVAASNAEELAIEIQPQRLEIVV
jgi:YegS/Rv2252/BmrU family lipid kinase